MLKIGLTGGIGSGKSVVSHHFERLNVPVIDTDLIAHELVEPGQPALQQITAVFGQWILDQAGELDRSKLRQQIFADPRKRRRLESILHPLIKTQVHNHVAGLTTPYCVIVVPLLIESAWQDLVDRILVVDTAQDLQISRVSPRDGLSEAQIRRIIQSQVDRPTRLAAADDIIINDDDIENLENSVGKLHEKYLRLALQLN